RQPAGSPLRAVVTTTIAASIEDTTRSKWSSITGAPPLALDVRTRRATGGSRTTGRRTARGSPPAGRGTRPRTSATRAAMDHLEPSYVLPLRAGPPRADLAPYLARLASLVDVVVADGSPPPVVAAHRAAWPAGVRHVALPAERRTPMGKVGGVLVGLELARHDKVVIADDDVAWTCEQ